MFNSIYKRCNSNDMDVRCDIVSGKLHAKFLDSPPDRSHVPPLVALVAQSVAYQRLRMMNTVGTGVLST